MLIPPSQLTSDTLRAVVEEFVSRDGTELTDIDIKIQQVLRQLEVGRAELHYDDRTQTTTIIFKDR